MKFGELKSIGHNIAYSFASGIGLLIEYCMMDVFGEAARSPEGFIAVDFLSGTTDGGQPSASLTRAIERYRGALFDLCAKHGTDPSAFRELTVSFSPNAPWGRFVVTVADQLGRKSVDEYVGVTGKRVKTLDELGRIRKK